MEYLKLAFLGVVQGLTEFLPISSSGHLVVIEKLINLHTGGIVVEVILHLATLLAVVFYYRKELLNYINHPFSHDTLRIAFLVILGSIPAGIIGVLFNDQIERLFDSTIYVGVSFLITGSFLFITKKQRHNENGITPQRALIIGAAQAFAIVPGISRSGSTIATALLLGISPQKAAFFSFMLLIPVTLGAGLLEFMKFDASKIGIPTLALVTGFLCALISGLIALRTIVLLTKKGSLYKFSIYLFIVGILTILISLF